MHYLVAERAALQFTTDVEKHDTEMSLGLPRPVGRWPWRCRIWSSGYLLAQLMFRPHLFSRVQMVLRDEASRAVLGCGACRDSLHVVHTD